jgi:dolichol-phosphate mannosyltransferase
VHLMVLSLLFKGLGSSFLAAQTTATMFTMTVNYLLNNTLTYRDRRLRGWAFLRGWVSFVLVCGVGAIANVGIAQYFFQQNGLWAASAIAGIVIGAVWNYVVTSVFTWKSRN